MMKPISKSLAAIKKEYTVVVVGSGYGAAVAASRLARAGQSVCVLERGREILPGSYPDGLVAAQGEMQIDASRGRLGNPYGMFNVHVNPDMLAIVGCGLGGTSLINANVALEMDPRQFDHAPWPDEFRADKDLLKAYTERAMAMLDAKPYPEDFPVLNKLAALEASAEVMSQPFYRPPIAVNFLDQVNPFGVAQQRCTLCGDCTSGCNDGSKNTTLMNYLPDAANHGAEIFTQARVSHVLREEEGWRVFFQGLATSTNPAAGAPTELPMSVKAEIVVLGAGALGSTEILLRSKAEGLSLSDRLGSRFSGNGDVLAFGYNNHWQTVPGKATDPPQYQSLYGIGRGSNLLAPEQLPGPCITGVIDMRKSARVEDALVIEEGVIPGAIASMIPPAAFMADALYGNFLQYGPQDAAARLMEAQAEGNNILTNPGGLVDDSYTGPVSRMQTYLVMSVDDAGGTLKLENDRLAIDWPGAGTSAVMARNNQLLAEATEAIHGHFIPNPLWSEPQGYKLATVHPLGGCGMGNDASVGVANHKCQVFASSSGTAVHPGLYVCDGAVLPGPAGVNPLLTISAVAERAMALLAGERGWTIDYSMGARRLLSPAEMRALLEAKPAPPAAAAPSAAEDKPLRENGFWEKLSAWAHTIEAEVLEDLHKGFEAIASEFKKGAIDVAKKLLHEIVLKYPDLLAPSFQFTEQMHGFVSTQPVGRDTVLRERITTDYEVATAWGRARNTPLEFELTISTQNLHTLTADASHPASIAGTVTCPALNALPMQVLSGDFHLLPIDQDAVETWKMTYDMVLQRESGRIRFHGYKVLHWRTGSHWWDDVTTLYITVHDGEKGDGPLLAQGILKLDLDDLLYQGSSIKLECAHGVLADLVNEVPAARTAIEMLYMGKFGGFFGGVLFQSYGGVLADLNNYPAQPGARPASRTLKAPAPRIHPIALADGFSIKLTRYAGGKKGPVLLAPGYTVRASSFAIDTVKENLVEFLTAQGYDVWLFDYRASPDSGSPIKAFTIDAIAEVDWPTAVDYVRTQTGAADVQVLAHCVGSMTLLMALLNGMKGVRSTINSALCLHPVTNWLNYLKVDLNAVRLLEGVSQLQGGFDVVPGTTQFEHEIDFAAWNLPVPPGEECKNPVCRRIFGIFGPSYTHAQLNEGTHNAMMEMFGKVALPPFEQLSLMTGRQLAVDHLGENRYVTAERAPNLALPITFITGAMNQIFVPESVARTLEWVRAHNGPEHYQQHVFEGYAHMDLFIGKNAADEVYPYLLEQLDRFNPVQ